MSLRWCVILRVVGIVFIQKESFTNFEQIPKQTFKIEPMEVANFEIHSSPNYIYYFLDVFQDCIMCCALQLFCL
jgi:hypothetical protein